MYKVLMVWSKQSKQLSGANVKLIDDRPDETEKVIQIAGTPEQAEKAQSLLQGFILSSTSLSLSLCGCSHAERNIFVAVE